MKKRMTKEIALMRRKTVMKKRESRRVEEEGVEGGACCF
jgi:hypothetical protein